MWRRQLTAETACDRDDMRQRQPASGKNTLPCVVSASSRLRLLPSPPLVVSVFRGLRRLWSLLLVVSAVSSAHSADRYWISPTQSNWDNTANWSTSSGGASGASVPGASD